MVALPPDRNHHSMAPCQFICLPNEGKLVKPQLFHSQTGVFVHQQQLLDQNQAQNVLKGKTKRKRQMGKGMGRTTT